MTAVAMAAVLGCLTLILLKGPGLNTGSALVCVLFGVVLAATPAGPAMQQLVAATGEWLWWTGRTL